MKQHRKDRSNEQIRHKGGNRNHMQAKPSFEDIHCIHDLFLYVIQPVRRQAPPLLPHIPPSPILRTHRIQSRPLHPRDPDV